MTSLSEKFIAWAEDPARTVEERYGLLRVVEYLWDYRHRAPDKPPKDIDAYLQLREDRRYDAAYEPVIDAAELRVVAGLLAGEKNIDLHAVGPERPIRDLSVLAFLPDLEELTLYQLEMERLVFLQHLPKLRKLRVSTQAVEDYGDIAACRELRSVSIQSFHPCPILSGLEKLPHLEELYWLTNGRTLADLTALPSLKKLEVNTMAYSERFCNCVRDFHQFPEMPQLEHFDGGWLYRLDGIERYPKLRFVRIRGYFKSLAPLAGLPAVTHVRVHSPEVTGVETIASMPSVYQFALHSRRPQDWTALFESSTLREVYQADCATPQPDLSTLRLLLPSRDDDFAVSPPRELKPLRLRVYDPHRSGPDAPPDPIFAEGPAGWDGSRGMRQSEQWWMHERVRQALDESKLLKLQRFHLDDLYPEEKRVFFHSVESHSGRRICLDFQGAENIARLREIVDCLRGVLATTRYPWEVYILASAEAFEYDWHEKTPEPTPEERLKLLIQEENEEAYLQAREKIFLHEQHRLEVLKELGHSPEPRNLGSTARPALPPHRKAEVEAEEDDDEFDEEEPEDRNRGGLADPRKGDWDESWLSAPVFDDPNHGWRGLSFNARLTREALWITPRDATVKALAYLLDVRPEYAPGLGPEDPDGE